MGRAVDVMLEKVEKLTKPMCRERSLKLQTLIDGVCGQLIDMFPESLDASFTASQVALPSESESQGGDPLKPALLFDVRELTRRLTCLEGQLRSKRHPVSDAVPLCNMAVKHPDTGEWGYVARTAYVNASGENVSKDAEGAIEVYRCLFKDEVCLDMLDGELRLHLRDGGQRSERRVPSAEAAS
jgi:hypothetical protein